MIYTRQQKSYLTKIYRFYAIHVDRLHKHPKVLNKIANKFNLLTGLTGSCPNCDPESRSLSSPSRANGSPQQTNACLDTCKVSPEKLLHYMIGQRKNKTWPLLGKNPKPESHILDDLPFPVPQCAKKIPPKDSNSKDLKPKYKTSWRMY